MAPLYQDDMHRVKNMRLKILESFDENKITDDIKEFMDKIWVRKNVCYVVVKITNCLDVIDTCPKNVVVLRKEVSF